MTRKTYVQQMCEMVEGLYPESDVLALNERRLGPFLFEASAAEIRDQAKELRDEVAVTRERLDKTVALMPDSMGYTRNFFEKVIAGMPSASKIANQMAGGDMDEMKATVALVGTQLANVDAIESVFRAGANELNTVLDTLPSWSSAGANETIKQLIDGDDELEEKNFESVFQRNWRPASQDAGFLKSATRAISRWFSSDKLMTWAGLDPKRVFPEMIALKKEDFESLIEGLPAERESVGADDEEVIVSAAEETTEAPGGADDAGEAEGGEAEGGEEGTGDEADPEDVDAPGSTPELKIRKNSREAMGRAKARIEKLRTAIAAYETSLDSPARTTAAREAREELRVAIADIIDSLAGQDVVSEGRMDDRELLGLAKDIVAESTSAGITRQVDDYRRWRQLAGMV